MFDMTIHAFTSLNQGTWPGATLFQALKQYSHVIDHSVQQAWLKAGLPLDQPISLYATAGYAREELFLNSDIDILILGTTALLEQYKSQLEHFLRILWDAKLPISHFICAYEALLPTLQQDLIRYTNFLELRLQCGLAIPEKILFNIIQTFSPLDFWQLKMQEMQKRHEKYGNSSYLLEPHIKNSPGALRDLQTYIWIAKRLFPIQQILDLPAYKLLTTEEVNTFYEHYLYLSNMRFALQKIADKQDERLLFENQKLLADLLSNTHAENNQAIEQMMNEYYHRYHKNNEIIDILSQKLENAILEKPTAGEPINPDYSITDHKIKLNKNKSLEKKPSIMIDIFYQISLLPHIDQIDYHTIRSLRKNRHLIQSDNPKIKKIFLTLFKTPGDIGKALDLMNRYNILELYLSAFSRLIGRMQYDLFHVYTVDKHLLTTVNFVFSFTKPNSPFDLAKVLIHQIKKRYLLYFAALYHDMGKGTEQDHSIAGEQLAENFSDEHNLSPINKKLLMWLVRNHLLMSMTAQKRDIYDPDVIEKFAREVGTVTKLNYLYLLTVADINATNPSLWNNWRDSLLKELYYSTLKCLHHPNKIYPIKEIVEEIKSAADQLLKDTVASSTVHALWKHWENKYFIRQTPETIAFHTQEILAHLNETSLVLIYDLPKGTEIFIYTKDKPLIIANTTAIIHKHNYTIVDAQILTTMDGYTLDTYVILENNGEKIKETANLEHLKKTLIKTLNAETLTLPTVHERLLSSRHKHFTIACQVYFYPLSTHYTIMELIAADRPGLLAKLATLFAKFSIQIRHAKISTLGEKVEDTFYITDNNKSALSKPLQEKLSIEIKNLLK